MKKQTGEICSCNKEKEIAEIHTKVKELHRAIMGNGQPGMLQEFNQAKGAILFNKWLLGASATGGCAGIIALVKIMFPGV